MNEDALLREMESIALDPNHDRAHRRMMELLDTLPDRQSANDYDDYGQYDEDEYDQYDEDNMYHDYGQYDEDTHDYNHYGQYDRDVNNDYEGEDHSCSEDEVHSDEDEDEEEDDEETKALKTVELEKIWNGVNMDKKRSMHELDRSLYGNDSYTTFSADFPTTGMSAEELKEEAKKLLFYLFQDPPVSTITQIANCWNHKQKQRAENILMRVYDRLPNGRFIRDPPLVRFARSGDLEMVKVMLDLGAPINESLQWTETESKHCYDKSWNWDGDSALVAAARNGHGKVVEVLLEHGASKTHRSCYRYDCYDSPESAARRVGYVEIADYIKAFGIPKE